MRNPTLSSATMVLSSETLNIRLQFFDSFSIRSNTFLFPATLSSALHFLNIWMRRDKSAPDSFGKGSRSSNVAATSAASASNVCARASINMWARRGWVGSEAISFPRVVMVLPFTASNCWSNSHAWLKLPDGGGVIHSNSFISFVPHCANSNTMGARSASIISAVRCWIKLCWVACVHKR